jgi:primosomal protein N' (replication factor Y)
VRRLAQPPERGRALDGWLALATGEARVVVGARSAVFAPVRDLRLIVVDEEHEPAYKQDETPRYHGRDVAVMRAKLAGRALPARLRHPSLESFVNAQAGQVPLLELPAGRRPPAAAHRHRGHAHRGHAKQRGFTALSRPAGRRDAGPLERREQTILFINRRGYSPSLLCTDLRHVEECAHCSIAMTYHRTDETLRCHLCGDQRPAPVRCPVRRARHPLAGPGHPAGRGGGPPGAPAGPHRADGHRHDGEEEPLPRDPGASSAWARSTCSWARR